MIGDGVFVYPGDIPASGTFTGRTAVEGRVGQNSGVTVISIQRGKVALVKDFRREWGAAR